MADAYLKVGDVQGNHNNANSGQYRGALQSYRKAKTLAEALTQRSPDDANFRTSWHSVTTKSATCWP
jgi:hypothetical protein